MILWPESGETVNNGKLVKHMSFQVATVDIVNKYYVVQHLMAEYSWFFVNVYAKCIILVLFEPNLDRLLSN